MGDEEKEDDNDDDDGDDDDDEKQTAGTLNKGKTVANSRLEQHIVWKKKPLLIWYEFKPTAVTTALQASKQMSHPQPIITKWWFSVSSKWLWRWDTEDS